jgi:hypothetical protein
MIPSGRRRRLDHAGVEVCDGLAPDESRRVAHDVKHLTEARWFDKDPNTTLEKNWFWTQYRSAAIGKQKRFEAVLETMKLVGYGSTPLPNVTITKKGKMICQVHALDPLSDDGPRRHRATTPFESSGGRAPQSRRTKAAGG